MHKQTIFFISLMTLFVTTVNANFYFGIGAGVTQGTVNTQFTYPTDQSAPTVANYTYALSAFTPSVALGYQRPFNKRWGIDVLVSTEMNAGAAINKSNNWFPGVNSYTSITLPWTYGMDVLATYNMNAAVTAFIGPGVRVAQFKSTSDLTGGVIGISGSYTKNVVGGQLMAGVDLFLTSTCKLRLSDQYTLYPAISTTWIEPISEQPFAGRYTLSTNTVMASVLFDF